MKGKFPPWVQVEAVCLHSPLRGRPYPTCRPLFDLHIYNEVYEDRADCWHSLLKCKSIWFIATCQTRCPDLCLSAVLRIRKNESTVDKFRWTYYLNISVQAANLSYCRIESNRKNRFGSENRIESNGNFFCPNWNAPVHSVFRRCVWQGEFPCSVSTVGQLLFCDSSACRLQHRGFLLLTRIACIAYIQSNLPQCISLKWITCFNGYHWSGRC